MCLCGDFALPVGYGYSFLLNCRCDQAYQTAQENECEDGDTIDAFNKKVNKSGISPTVTTRPEGFKTAILIQEATKKGYAEATDGDGVYINRPHQKRGVVQKDKIQTIKTTPDVGVVVEKKIKYEEPLEREGWHKKAKEVLNPDGISNCIPRSLSSATRVHGG